MAATGVPVVIGGTGVPVVISGIAPGIPIIIQVDSATALLISTAAGVGVFTVDTTTPLVTVAAPIKATLGGVLVSGTGNVDLQNSGQFRVYSNGAAAGYIFSQVSFRSHGTFAAPSAVVSGDSVIEYDGYAYNNGAYQPSVQIIGLVDSAPGATQVPGRLSFWLATAAAAPTERVRLDSSGVVSIAGTGKVASLSGVIGLSVVSTAYTLGTAGTVVVPNANMSGAANDAARDVLVGNIDGAIAVDTGIAGRMYLRDGGAWKFALFT